MFCQINLYPVGVAFVVSAWFGTVVQILQERRLHLVMTIEDPRLAIIVKRKLYCTFQTSIICFSYWRLYCFVCLIILTIVLPFLTFGAMKLYRRRDLFIIYEKRRVRMFLAFEFLLFCCTSLHRNERMIIRIEEPIAQLFLEFLIFYSTSFLPEVLFSFFL